MFDVFRSVILPAFIFALVPSSYANPSGGSVAQGSASFSSKGSQFTVQQNSPFAHINWQSFNIAPGETTTFLQPSTTSLIWNQINDVNPSQILGNINANGFVVLQNQSGFVVGGQAAVTAHGLIMTTGRITPPDILGGGAWQFDAPPPTAKIINYGRLDIGGGPAYLISSDIENHGTISDPGGHIGLVAGQSVLLSMSPDGRGLSAQVTLPQGSVDNSGKLIADGGSILVQAKVVNQGGLVQANSVRQVNGAIELYASDSINLGANSTISAQGDSQGVSQGGSVIIKAGNSFSDQKTSSINVSGGAQGGDGGHIEISAPHIAAINSSINGHAANGYTAGDLLIDPDFITLTDYGNSAPDNGTVNVGDNPGESLTFDVSTFNDLINNNNLSKISLEANYDIEVATLWSVPDSTVKGSSLNLTAHRNILIDDNSGILAGKNWSINMTAGTELTSAANVVSGNDGIYLGQNAMIQTLDGNINLKAANEVILDYDYFDKDPTLTGITTLRGGNITVNTTYGDVNSGADSFGYDFKSTATKYTVSSSLGGISTAKGGDVNITAGGNVISHLTIAGDFANSAFEGGIGAFDPNNHGDVTIESKNGNIYGHYLVADGNGTIKADNGDAGGAVSSQGLSLSLAKGGWTVNAPKGNIYLQEVRNPNGALNGVGGTTAAAYHLFDYSDDASLTLDAGNLVEITGLNAPRNSELVPLIFPPTLNVNAGAVGFQIDTDVILYPSAKGNLSITTTDNGNFVGTSIFSGSGITPTLSMSDSSLHQWLDSTSFTPTDFQHRANPPNQVGNGTPVSIHIAGSMETVNLITSKATHLKVDHNIVNSGFVGQNLDANDHTTIDVGGYISNQPFYSFYKPGLTTPIVPADPLNPFWDSIFSVLVDPSLIKSTVLPDNITPTDLKLKAITMLAFPASPGSNPNPGFVYDAKTGKFGYGGIMSVATLTALTGTADHPLEAITIGPNGLPEVSNGHFVTHPVTFVPNNVIGDLYTQSLLVPKSPLLGFQIGGPGFFDITVKDYIDLGSSDGIESWGVGNLGKLDYSYLAPFTAAGAAIDVEVQNNLSMVTSRIASMDGGKVTVNSINGQMDLGSQELFGTSPLAFGIYTSGHSDVKVTAEGDININGSRIAAYNGGNVTVESYDGNVNAGSGGNINVNVPLVTSVLDPKTHQLVGVSSESPIYGSGIIAMSLPKYLQTPDSGTAPGDINVTTPHGDIVSGQAGILQLSLDGSVAGAPKVNLKAGTDPSDGDPGFVGNIDLGDFPLIGGTVNLTASGNIHAKVFSRQSSTINAAQNFSGILFSGGNATVSAGGGITGTIVAVGGISASGSSVTATLLSQSVSVGGSQSTSTLGATATASTTAQSAAQQSSTETKQQVVASNDSETDDQKKKKKGPVLQRVKRVTVILPKA